MVIVLVAHRWWMQAVQGFAISTGRLPKMDELKNLSIFILADTIQIEQIILMMERSLDDRCLVQWWTKLNKNRIDPRIFLLSFNASWSGLFLMLTLSLM